MQNYPSDKELYKVVQWVMNRLSYQFAFGYYTNEDLVQWAYIKSKEVMHKWDRERPLDKFLSFHLRNQLCNLRRKKLERIDAPCLDCPFDAWINQKCQKFANMDDCDLFRRWRQRNADKKSIMEPVVINDDIIRDSTEYNSVEIKDFFMYIKGKLTNEEYNILFKYLNDNAQDDKLDDILERVKEWAKDQGF